MTNKTSMKDLGLARLQEVNAALSALIEQAVLYQSTTKVEQDKSNTEQDSLQNIYTKPKVSLLVSCFIPDMEKEYWETCLNQNQHPCLDACVALEIRQDSLPELYTHIQEITKQMNKLLKNTYTVQHNTSSQVDVKEKQFLFFGVLDHD